MPPTLHFQKAIRLSQSNYRGQKFYFITLCCHDRQKRFANRNVCKWLLNIFEIESAARDFAVHAYCVMPNHFHFLVEGIKTASDLLIFVKTFKIKSSRVYAEEDWPDSLAKEVFRPHPPKT